MRAMGLSVARSSRSNVSPVATCCPLLKSYKGRRKPNAWSPGFSSGVARRWNVGSAMMSIGVRGESLGVIDFQSNSVGGVLLTREHGCHASTNPS